MSGILDGLNNAQREAVMATEGCYRVIAGAGSGKTRALSHRFAYLVTEMGILPSSILCVTFTNKAASEMRKRIRTLTGDNDTGYISTFHGFCVSVLQEDSHAVGYPKSFLVLDNADIDQMLKIIYEERNLSLRDMTFQRARDMIEERKLGRDPEYYEYMIALSLDELKQKYDEAVQAEDVIFWGYLYNQKKCFGLDYNDLIVYVLYLFKLNDEIRLKWQSRLEYIMIDEFQDIDGLQYELMRVLADYHKNLFIVGDPDQTIYSWRGASVRFLLEFDTAFPNVQTIMMMNNYRSTPQILAVANALIDKNVNRIKKELLPVPYAKDGTVSDGALPVYHHAKTAEQEARWIAHQIKTLQDQGTTLSDIAILYRAHFVSRVLEEVFLHEQLPYTIFSGIQFFSRMEIKDALSYLRLVVYHDDLSFLRVVNVPKRNMGKRRIEFLTDYAAKNGCSLFTALENTIDDDIFKNTKARHFLKFVSHYTAMHPELPVSELFSKLLDESGYEALLRTEGSQERLDNLAELKQAIREFEITCGEETTPEAYLSHVALMTNADADPGRQAVKMTTVHTAKGLEFPHVFIAGFNEGIFPSKKTATKEAMEEERRLAFVAVTRAERGLYITDAEGRNLDGSYRYPSRFVFNIDRELLHYTIELDPRLVVDARMAVESNEKMLELRTAGPVYRPGDRIAHSIMGQGEILDIDADKGAYLIKFDTLETPRKVSMRANLSGV
jgi:DNA helicase-2/ATP-dependent DNA helicase PcrA